MTPLSPTAMEEAAKAAYHATPRNKPYDKLTLFKKNMYRSEATAAITAYLAQGGKEGWVMVRGTEVDGLRSALKGLSDMYTWTWDKVDGGLMMSSSGVERFEKEHQRAYEILYPDRPLITDENEEAAAAQNGGE